MPLNRSERAIRSPVGPGTVPPVTVKMVTRSALRRRGMPKAIARAVSVLPFQAITIDRPISVGGRGGFQLPTSRFGDRELRAQGDVGEPSEAAPDDGVSG